MKERTPIEPGAVQLRDWMRRRGFNTQAECAGFLEIDQRFVSQFLNETGRPGLRVALLIERKTGIPVEAWASIALDEPELVTAENGPKSRFRKV